MKQVDKEVIDHPEKQIWNRLVIGDENLRCFTWDSWEKFQNYAYNDIVREIEKVQIVVYSALYDQNNG